MHIQVIDNGFEIPDVLRTYTEARVWLATQCAGDRLAWAGVRFVPKYDRRSNEGIVCRIELWLWGIGPVAVSQVDANPYVALDRAAVRLERIVVREIREIRGLRRAGCPPVATAVRDTTARRHRMTAMANAVVVLPPDARPPAGLITWLRTRYGVELVQTVSLGGPEWDALVAGEIGSPHLERFKDRLAMAQLCHPKVIVVVGGVVPRTSCGRRPPARREVEWAVNQIRAWRLPADVVGVWVNEPLSADERPVESTEPPRTKGGQIWDGNPEPYADVMRD